MNFSLVTSTAIVHSPLQIAGLIAMYAAAILAPKEHAEKD